MGKATLTSRQRYNRLYRKVDQDFGLAARPPMQAVPSGGGYAYTQEGSPAIALSPKERHRLVSRKPAVRRDARFAVLHELGHLTGREGEPAANHKANVVSRRLNKQQARNQALSEAARKRKSGQ